MEKQKIILGGLNEKEGGIVEKGISCGADMALVFGLGESLKQYVYDHFQNLRLAVCNTKKKK